MSRQANRAKELAGKAVRASKDRNALRHRPDAIANRVLRHVELITALRSDLAGQAKEDALSVAWDAYGTLQGILDHESLYDIDHRAVFDTIDTTEAAADIDGYALSRMDVQCRETECEYEGWSGDHFEWN